MTSDIRYSNFCYWYKIGTHFDIQNRKPLGVTEINQFINRKPDF